MWRSRRKIFGEGGNSIRSVDLQGIREGIRMGGSIYIRNLEAVVVEGGVGAEVAEVVGRLKVAWRHRREWKNSRLWPGRRGLRKVRDRGWRGRPQRMREKAGRIKSSRHLDSTHYWL